jgi:hypothetical protein
MFVEKRIRDGRFRGVCLGGKVDEKKGRTVWGKAHPDLLFDSPRCYYLFIV